MDFITYHFDSSTQFYAELKDLLQEGGFHDSPESQVNTFISLIVQFQDEFLDASGQDLAQCCYRLFDSDLFQNNTLSISSAIIDRAIQSQVEQDMWITYHVLFYAGIEFPKVYNWMLTSEFFAKLKYQILQLDGMRLQPLAVSLMHEICRVQSLKPRDLERTRTDADEGLNYGAIRLLLAFNEQYMLHQAACKAAYNYTPSNPLLSALADRFGVSCTFSENLIFMLNRAEDPALQTLILKLLYLLFTSPKTCLSHFFYTNDLHVLVDVIIRELWNLPEEQEALRHAYLRVLGPLLTNTQLATQEQQHGPATTTATSSTTTTTTAASAAMYKRVEILKVLGQLGGSEMDDELRQYLWEQEWKEQEQIRLVNEMRKLTYRDRESSNASPAPSISSLSSSRSSSLSTTASSISISSSSYSALSPSLSPSNIVAGSDRTTSPIMISKTLAESTDETTTHSRTEPCGGGGDSSSSGSVILENVLPPSRSNSSTNLHVHMSDHTAAGEQRHGSFPSQPHQKRYGARSASPTTLRLVERILREWLEGEMRPATTASTTTITTAAAGARAGVVGKDERIIISAASQ
ncbi:hypothetical protein EDD11_009091 [Mortierella claussenii]|nr:hypothetical protein EDD11_009091 [Mortierella claussenii]